MTTLSDDERAQMKSNLDIIGRDDINDLEAVLSFVGHYDVDGYHRVPDNCPAEFTWDYEKGAKPQLDKLYEKAKKAQWNGQTDLDWSIEVDQEKVVLNNNEANQDMMQWGQVDLSGMKTFHITESQSLQLRGDAFNALNIASYAPPNAQLEDAAYANVFGQITKTNSSQRIMQVSMHYSF